MGSVVKISLAVLFQNLFTLRSSFSSEIAKNWRIYFNKSLFFSIVDLKVKWYSDRGESSEGLGISFTGGALSSVKFGKGMSTSDLFISGREISP